MSAFHRQAPPPTLVQARELELGSEEARGARERAELVRGGLTEELGEVGTPPFPLVAPFD